MNRKQEKRKQEKSKQVNKSVGKEKKHKTPFSD